jgi:hypothetical protein
MASGSDRKEKVKSGLALFIGLFIAVVVSELVLQMMDIPPQPVSGWVNCPEKHPGQCNQLGFRGQTIAYSPDDFVTVILGDSEVYAARLDFEDVPERRLEHYLRNHGRSVKVFTIGDMGYGQDQQYLSLREYFKKFRADLVVLMFTARNDLENNIFPSSGRNYTPKPTFWLENGALKGPTERWLDEVGTKFKLLLFWQKYSSDTIGRRRSEFWEKHVLPPPYQPLNRYGGKVDYSWHERWIKDPKLAYKGIEFEKVGPANQFTPRSMRRQYAIDLTRQLFSRIKSLVESHGGHFIIFKEERPWEMDGLNGEKVFVLKGKYYKTSMNQYRENFKELFEGFEHYRIPLGINNYTVNAEDLHLNAEAIDLLMKRLADIISMKPYFSDRQSGRS